MTFVPSLLRSTSGSGPHAITLGHPMLDDYLAFVAARHGAQVVRLEDGEVGLSARTIRRRLSSVSGLFAYLLARGDAGVVANPVPKGFAARRPSARIGARGVLSIRG